MIRRRLTTITIQEQTRALALILIWAPVGLAVLAVLFWLLTGSAGSDQVGSVPQ